MQLSHMGFQTNEETDNARWAIRLASNLYIEVKGGILARSGHNL